MMQRLAKRVDVIARRRQEEMLRAVAKRLRGIFGEAAVEVEEARVLVSGRGTIKRWLIDPELRFLSGGLK